MIEIIALASAFIAVMSFFTLLLALFTVIELQAMKKSTHQIEYMPLDPKAMEIADDWATSEESIQKEMDKYKEDMKKDPAMSFFNNELTDKDIRSF